MNLKSLSKIDFLNKITQYFHDNQSHHKSSMIDDNSEIFKSIFSEEMSQRQEDCLSILLSTELTTLLDVSNIRYRLSSLFLYYVRGTVFFLCLLSIALPKFQIPKKKRN